MFKITNNQFGKKLNGSTYEILQVINFGIIILRKVDLDDFSFNEVSNAVSILKENYVMTKNGIYSIDEDVTLPKEVSEQIIVAALLKYTDLDIVSEIKYDNLQELDKILKRFNIDESYYKEIFK